MPGGKGKMNIIPLVSQGPNSRTSSASEMSESHSLRKKKTDGKDRIHLLESQVPRYGARGVLRGSREVEKPSEEETLGFVMQYQALWGLQEGCSENLIDVQFF